MKIYLQLKEIVENSSLPEHDVLLNLCNEVIDTLETESDVYRPRDKSERYLPGGLLDFTKYHNDVPIVVIPDLHARVDFLMNILDFEIQIKDEKKSIYEFLKDKKIRIICVGDIFHSEGRCFIRWKESYSEYLKGNILSDGMKLEMQENLILLQLLLILKKNFSEDFHILKGNHENILNEEGNGNHPFYKFANEGNMFYDFMCEVYGDALIYVISCFEHALPICAISNNLIVSHAEPAKSISRNKIINYRKNPQTVLDLTWTSNDSAIEDSVKKTIKNLLGKFSNNVTWIGGHRPVENNFSLRQSGLFVQIHNPSQQNIAIVFPDEKFDPLKDIKSVCKE